MELSRVNDKSVGREKLYYEVVLFSQQEDYNKLWFSTKTVTYANEIADRVMSSVELIQLSK
jgi:hypothetical protein